MFNYTLWRKRSKILANCLSISFIKQTLFFLKLIQLLIVLIVSLSVSLCFRGLEYGLFSPLDPSYCVNKYLWSPLLFQQLALGTVNSVAFLLTANLCQGNYDRSNTMIYSALFLKIIKHYPMTDRLIVRRGYK
jgi:hypothetical protein